MSPKELILQGKNADEFTKNLISIVGVCYGVKKLSDEVKKKNSALYTKDAYICLKNIIDAVVFIGKTPVKKLAALREAKNLYNQQIFLAAYGSKETLVKNLPDFITVINDMRYYDNCFNMNPYNMINTILTLIKCQITGYDLKQLVYKGIGHIERFIQLSLMTNNNWNQKTLTSAKPKLVIPIGAAGCGKSTFYRELSNVINISCDNIRYLLFEKHGPCFQSWESTLSWWIVNFLTDYYLSRGYSVFYNGVNTDMQYRTPISMEVHDSLYEGLKYDIRLVYFEPPVKLNPKERAELKSVNLWANPIEKLDLSKISSNVKKILDMIKNNFERTMQRTKEIREGKKQQDPFDILYSVPAPIVKLFVEQGFDKPTGKNVIVIPRKEIPTEAERIKFYKNYAIKTLA